MAVDFATMIYGPCLDAYAVPVTFYPIASQPGAASYAGRGIFDTETTTIAGEDGSIISDQRTTLDILEKEFSVVPRQSDRVYIPLDCNGKAIGMMEVVNAWTNGGGETTLTLKEFVETAP